MAFMSTTLQKEFILLINVTLRNYVTSLIWGYYEKQTMQGYFELFFKWANVDRKDIFYYHARVLLTQNITHFKIEF